jgi:hypothetical protein
MLVCPPILPCHPIDILDEANNFFVEEEYDEALRLYSKLLNDNDENVGKRDQLFVSRSVCYFQLEKPMFVVLDFV